ncbi:hypothetical protein L596_014663 [Steinernema carpocapsae]|uniref:G-protein coupled receptors family 1 profile domain-containing protein n=1 Tax=Steinernema carpocapsae TaxID=34508 RepID=A0A4U5ND25_STECR|nr:hypothetical protein L596_014663 [Steinernema carpocapsae]
MHTTSAFSVWCWLLLSVLRYIAVFHPLTYRTIWRQPRYAIILIGISSAFIEAWIPFTVTYDAKYKSCSESTDSSIARSTQAYHLMDIMLSYVIPACIRIGLDGVVLSYCYNPFRKVQLPSLLRKKTTLSPDSCVSDKKKPHYQVLLHRRATISKSEATLRRKHTMILRSILISAINLCCNLPCHLLRLLLTLEEDPVSACSAVVEYSLEARVLNYKHNLQSSVLCVT